MTTGLRTQHVHPDGSKSPVFEYLPDREPFWFGPCGFIPRRVRKEPGVRIIYDGVRIFRPNSFYDHISSLEPSRGDIF